MDSQSAPTIEDVPDHSRVEIRLGDERAGFVAYERRPGRIAFLHTEIAPRFEGQGLASKLIKTVLDTAREEGLAVQPDCPFVRGYIARHASYLDLVPEQERGRFGLGPGPASSPPPTPGA